MQYNELDVAATYKAQLLIAECKTGRAGLDAQTLDDIVTVSDLLGRGFVIKVLATNQSMLDSTNHTQETAYKDFITKATRKGIRVVPREELPKLREILEEKAKKPDAR